MVGGFRVPRGATLLVNLWGIHNDPKIWPEPRQYKPESFEGLEGNRAGCQVYAFGVGEEDVPWGRASR